MFYQMRDNTFKKKQRFRFEIMLQTQITNIIICCQSIASCWIPMNSTYLEADTHKLAHS